MSRAQRKRNRAQQERRKTQAARIEEAVETSAPTVSRGEGDATHADVELTSRAVKERWPIDEEKRPHIVKEMTDLATGPEQKARTKIAASRVLVAMDRLNLDDEKRDDAKPTQDTNVQVNVAVISPALERLDDSDLERYITETGALGASEAPSAEGPAAAPVVSPLSNGTATGVSAEQ